MCQRFQIVLKESIKRAKDLPCEGLQPIFKNLLGGGELISLAFTEKLKSFRPKLTILEAEGEAAKSKHLKGPSSQWVDVTKKKRAVHDEIINLVHQKHEKKPLSLSEEMKEESSPKKKAKKDVRGSKRKERNFKDKENYISSIPMNHHTEAGLSVRGNEGGSNRLESAILDLVADDSTGIQKQKSSYHWDKIKTESGAKVKANKTRIYQKWKSKTHSKASLRGTDAEDSTIGSATFAGKPSNFKGGKQQQSIPNANVRSEVKNLEQVRKDRQNEANRITHMKTKTKGNKKFGRGGKKGKGRKRLKFC
ncbi:hypothetical protein MLD38_036171 [Melastoma candidum]|uniref:Uncharacterized protein n=1 Tax=Melastoma candidum TaxID=119954 RepID=A0ACB9LIU3_9MYRT|nr:hypothetical protein MLD38_036171 [Melastoma candidum]